MYVVTKEARLRVGVPSKVRSSLIMRYALDGVSPGHQSGATNQLTPGAASHGPGRVSGQARQ